MAANNLEVALRFFDSTRSTIAQLAKMPGIGSPYSGNNSRLQELRKWAVKGFRKYLIFYFERDDAIEVIRILYATQNVSSILEGEV
ncbi:type II toxin-antitoxin system RelE/ParE family toxin [Pantanalinema rosaneae CENA516]|uniref:type II toxin-antitoxin system RelE/ParE family toxin n=1 Tax=Pantanalinema rosaneae TaxID=1620701 RepID=UPI003D6FA030